MKHDIIENRMRALENFTSLRLLPGVWAIIRMAGCRFSRFSDERFEKPFDARLHEMMIAVARALLTELQGVYVCTHSDEISLLLNPQWRLLGRRLEKVVSMSASIASATFTHEAKIPAHFDSRVWLGADKNDVIDYFRWRQSDSERCALSTWCYWLLRQDGNSRQKATQELSGKSVEFKYRLLRRHGVNFKEVPLWQRRGSALYWEKYRKRGYDPKRKEQVSVVRRRLKVNKELPAREGYAELLKQVVNR